jgi:hypothetical protein
MDSTKLPLRTWLLAFYITCFEGLNTRQMAKRIGLGYQGAWLLHKKIRATIPNGVKEGQGQVALDAAMTNLCSARLTLYQSARGTSRSVFSQRSDEPTTKVREVRVFGANITISELSELAKRPAQSIMTRMRGGQTAEEAAFGHATTRTRSAEAVSTRDVPVTDEQVRTAFAEQKTVSRTAQALGIKAGTCWSRCDALGLLTSKRKIATRKKATPNA